MGFVVRLTLTICSNPELTVAIYYGLQILAAMLVYCSLSTYFFNYSSTISTASLLSLQLHII